MKQNTKNMLIGLVFYAVALLNIAFVEYFDEDITVAVFSLLVGSLLIIDKPMSEDRERQMIRRDIVERSRRQYQEEMKKTA